MASEEYLKKIARFNPPLIGWCKYEIALASLETYYSFPNNNRIRVFIKKWFDISIPVGCYEIKSINNELQRQIEEKGGKMMMSYYPQT